MPSAAALDLNASRSALSFALPVPFVAGGLESSTNQAGGVAFALPPSSPIVEPPAAAGVTIAPATQRNAATRRRMVLDILSQSSFVRRQSSQPRRLGTPIVSDIHADVSTPSGVAPAATWARRPASALVLRTGVRGRRRL